MAALLTFGALTNAVDASAGGYTRRGTFAFAGGVTNPSGDINEFTNSSGVIHFAAGRHISRTHTLQIEWTHNWLSIDPAVIDRAATDSASIDNAYASMYPEHVGLYPALLGSVVGLDGRRLVPR
jgi:hypothetical protein